MQCYFFLSFKFILNAKNFFRQKYRCCKYIQLVFSFLLYLLSFISEAFHINFHYECIKYQFDTDSRILEPNFFSLNLLKFLRNVFRFISLNLLCGHTGITLALKYIVRTFWRIFIFNIFILQGTHFLIIKNYIHGR